jgi:hypothetical protein
MPSDDPCYARLRQREKAPWTQLWVRGSICLLNAAVSAANGLSLDFVCGRALINIRPAQSSEIEGRGLDVFK